MLPLLIRQLGADPGAVLAEAGLAANALDSPEGRVPYASLARLLRLSAARSGCAHFGLLAGRMWRLADLGLLGELVASGSTARVALQTLLVHQHLHSGGGVGFMLEREGTVDVGYAVYHPGVSNATQLYDAVLAGIFNFLREMCGAQFMPSGVMLPHSAPVDPLPYRKLFKIQPRFNAEYCAIRLPAALLDRPLVGADAARWRSAQRRVVEQGRVEFLQQVFRALRTLLLHGECSGDAVASALAMHRRTLNRRLKARGISFQHVLDEVRFEVARQLLSESVISLDDIAATLGYAGIGPFMRSFRRWAGTTPGNWRRDAANGGFDDDPVERPLPRSEEAVVAASAEPPRSFAGTPMQRPCVENC